MNPLMQRNTEQKFYANLNNVFMWQDLRAGLGLHKGVGVPGLIKAKRYFVAGSKNVLSANWTIFQS